MSVERKVAIITFSDKGLELGKVIQREFYRSKLYTSRPAPGNRDIIHFDQAGQLLEKKFHAFDTWIFVGALGICVRSIAPYIGNKKTDPAVVNMDDEGRFAQPVLGGHAGGANDLARKLSHVFSGQAVITTSSDLQDIWPLDLLADRFKWTSSASRPWNGLISIFANRRPTALLLDIQDEGTAYLEKTKPAFVDIYYHFQDIRPARYELLLYVGYRLLSAEIPVLSFFPKCLCLGSGCSRDIEPRLFEAGVFSALEQEHLAWQSIAALASASVKADERAYLEITRQRGWDFVTYAPEELAQVKVPNPSPKVLETVGVEGVAESAAAVFSGNAGWIVEKTKHTVDSGKKFTLAVSVMRQYTRSGRIAIVGAGPGAAGYITVMGQELLQTADCILYAGSLVPEELTRMARPDALVRNSAYMTLEEQMQLVDTYYARGKLIVRLHSGDPSIYGAIQEQMQVFDEKGYDYFIVPGISSFQAAAAVLRSEFTVPEVAQTIILTRGEGNTPMPPNEKLEEMARLQATMCIYLSAGISKKVETQLLQHYSPETPLAVLYRVTWKDEQVWTGQLDQLDRIISENKLTRTVLIIVGEAIGARRKRSWLYGDNWYHIFRKKTTVLP